VVSVLVAVVIASSFEPVAKFFSKYKIPRGVSVGVSYLLIIAVLIGGIALFLPKIVEDLAGFIKNLPGILSSLNSVQVFGRDVGFSDLSLYVSEISQNIDKGQILTVIKNSLSGAGTVAHTTGIVIGNIVNFVIILVLSFYLAAQEKGVENFLKIITPKDYERYIIGLWERSQRKISQWAQGQLLLSFIMAVIIYVPLSILGVPYAAMLACIAFLGELIPVVGMTLAMIPALFIALSAGGVSMFVATLITYLVAGQVENHILYPKVMDRVVGVPSVVVIISIIIGAQVAGFWGIVLAVPLASILLEFISDLGTDKIPNTKY
jgi:predicted PurR-regulated permease PerM